MQAEVGEKVGNVVSVALVAQAKTVEYLIKEAEKEEVKARLALQVHPENMERNNSYYSLRPE